MHLCLKSSNKRTTIFIHMYFTYIYIKGTDRTIFQVVNHKKRRKKEKRNKNGWGKKKRSKRTTKLFFTRLFPCSESANCCAQMKSRDSKIRVQDRCNETSQWVEPRMIRLSLGTLGTANDILSGSLFFLSFFLFFSLFFFLMLTFPRFHGRVLLEARIAERQSPLGSMWKAWRIYFQLSPFNSTGLLNPRSCVRTVIATDPFFSLTPSLPLPPLSLLSPSDIDACVSCLFIYSPPSVSRFFTVFPFSCQRNFIPGNHGMPFRIAVRH